VGGWKRELMCLEERVVYRRKGFAGVGTVKGKIPSNRESSGRGFSFLSFLFDEVFGSGSLERDLKKHTAEELKTRSSFCLVDPGDDPH
jgi:hypothetical protein